MSPPGGWLGFALVFLVIAACSAAGGADVAANGALRPVPPTSGLGVTPAGSASTEPRVAETPAGEVATPVQPTAQPTGVLPTATVASSTVPRSAVPITTVPPTGAPTVSSSTVPPTIDPATTTSTTHVPAAVTAGALSFTIEPVTAEQLGASWRPGCPVGPEDLARLTVTFHGFDGAIRDGALIVHRDWAEPLAGVFQTLYEAGFAIERIEPVDRYGADDDASMAANNTSAFNCRLVAGTSRWSEHSYGRAVDLNPLVNPYVKGGVVDPPGGAAYLDRSAQTPGLIAADGVVVAAFARIGWGWGGNWNNAQDYQHFSATGR